MIPDSSRVSSDTYARMLILSCTVCLVDNMSTPYWASIRDATTIQCKAKNRSIDENNIHKPLSLRPSRLKELNKAIHLGEVIKRLHLLNTVPDPVLVLLIKLSEFHSSRGGLSYVERLLRGPASKVIRVARSVMYDMVNFGFVLHNNIKILQLPRSY